jgi:hypothetical protein
MFQARTFFCEALNDFHSRAMVDAASWNDSPASSPVAHFDLVKYE